MNWEAVGAIGEVAGAAGVIITLIYLAVQIRQNTFQITENSKLVRANVSSMMAQQTSESITFIFNQGAMELMVEGAKDFESLPLVERMRFDAINQQMMSRFESLYVHYTMGLLTDGQWAAKRTALERRLAFKGVQQWWERSQDEYEPGFRRFIAEAVAQSVASPREHPAAAPRS